VPNFKDFRLPDVGEGLTEGEILKWHVAVGDTVVVNQTIVEIETAKAAVELPSPYAGVVTDLKVGEGDTVDVGTPIITIDTDPSGAPAEPPSPPSEAASPPSEAASPPSEAASPPSDHARVNGPVDEPSAPSQRAADLAATEFVPAAAAEAAASAESSGGSSAPGGGRQAVLVGYGVREGGLTRRPRKAEGGPVRPSSAKPTRAGGLELGRSVERALSDVGVLAKPPVRKLAKDLGVDLARIAPTGPGGTVSRTDVELAAGGPAPGGTAVGSAVRGERGERREPIKGVRKRMAEAMVSSAFTAPHVTEWVTVDVTRSMRLLDRMGKRKEYRDLRLSPLLLVARALLHAAKRNPLINSTWDDSAQEVVVKDYVNLGIAAATPRGLTVPNIKDADLLPLPELARALGQLVAVAKEGKTSPADMAGGTVTITNVGVFGVDGGTPIINPGESAILCMGAVKLKPWVHKGKLKPRQVMELSLSFDHRHVDGETGSKVLADVAAVLEDPALAL